ncbi:MAG TPA: peptidylprolyl isomerase [Verrucomicrobiae bacterium]|nr:peptidylprolyl isomerase [Verrucomicrobiae bacterium]
MRRIAPWVYLLAAALAIPATAAAQTTSTPARRAHTHTDPALYHPAELRAKAPAEYEVKFVTTKGDFVIQATRAWAPLGADRFYNLVRHGYFKGDSFFRVVPGFVVQFGLSPSPGINKAWEKATIKDDPVSQSNRAGTITFATSGTNTRTTQVFINMGDNSQLDSQGFSPFGQVTSGLDVVQALYSGYGDLPEMGGRGPSEDRISSEGKVYLEKDFPKLDSIVTAEIISPAPAAEHSPHKSGGAAGAGSSKQ